MSKAVHKNNCWRKFKYVCFNTAAVTEASFDASFALQASYLKYQYDRISNTLKKVHY